MLVYSKKKFELNINHVRQRLQHYFNFDHLGHEQAITFLIGLESKKSTIKALSDWDIYSRDWGIFIPGIKVLNGDEIGGIPRQYCGEEFSENLPEIVEDDDFFDNEAGRFVPFIYLYNQLLEYWKSGKHPEVTTPEYFIDWSLTKGHTPPWLNRAIEFGLYIPKQGATACKIAHANSNEIQFFDQTSINYPSELHIALQAWQAVSASEGKGKPKARIKAWLIENNKELKKNGKNEVTKEAMERISIVVNWEKNGGATRSSW